MTERAVKTYVGAGGALETYPGACTYACYRVALRRRRHAPPPSGWNRAACRRAVRTVVPPCRVARSVPQRSQYHGRDPESPAFHAPSPPRRRAAFWSCIASFPWSTGRFFFHLTLLPNEQSGLRLAWGQRVGVAAASRWRGGAVRNKTSPKPVQGQLYVVSAPVRRHVGKHKSELR